MRGKHYTNGVDIALAGITPAHAGKTFGGKRCYRKDRDHPRACGENEETGEITDIVAGSPPRMRGKPCSAVCVTTAVGITPAHAGKTHR